MEMNQATMKKSPAVQLEAPRLEHGKALLIAGLREHYTPETMKKHPWAMAAPWASHRQHPRTGGSGDLWRVLQCAQPRRYRLPGGRRGLQLFRSSPRTQRRDHPGTEVCCFLAPRTCFEAL